MEVIHGLLDGVLIIKPCVIPDDRGLFFENFHATRYEKFNIENTFKQDNYSFSQQNVIRGLHAQAKNPQAKLIQVVTGTIFDVLVDARPDSRTFGLWESNVIGDKMEQIYVPPGILHGFFVLSGAARIEYKCSEYYDPQDEIGVRWNDPGLGIEWPATNFPRIYSQKDSELKTFEEMRPIFENFRGLK